jgi:hypothetical protein
VTTTELKLLARRLAAELHFQPSEIDRLTIADALWWLTD